MKRRLAREIAVQSLYQMEMNEVGAAEAVNMLINEAAEDNETEVVIRDADVMRTYVTEIVQGAWNNKEAIDGLLVDYLKGWQISRLSRVDRQILRLSTYEMVFRDASRQRYRSMKRLNCPNILVQKNPVNSSMVYLDA